MSNAYDRLQSAGKKKSSKNAYNGDLIKRARAALRDDNYTLMRSFSLNINGDIEQRKKP